MTTSVEIKNLGPDKIKASTQNKDGEENGTQVVDVDASVILTIHDGQDIHIEEVNEGEAGGDPEPAPESPESD